jgi:hypothetical protein
LSQRSWHSHKIGFPMKLKHRKSLFLVMMTLVAGSSIALYGTMEGNLVSNIIQIAVLQQLVGAAIYLGCFGTGQARAPFE